MQTITSNTFPILSFNEKEFDTNVITSYMSNVIKYNDNCKFKYRMKQTNNVYGSKNVGLEQDSIVIGAV